MANYNHRVGERYLTNEGDWVEIIEYFTALNATIRFDDGTIVRNIKYSRFEKGTISKPKNRLGEVFINKNNCKFTIIAYRGATDIDLKFEDGTILYNRQYRDAVLATAKNPNYPSIYERGYIGVGRHLTCIDGKDTKVYTTWQAMFARCYNKKELEKHPTYIGCSVTEEWYNFQVFGDWFEGNWKPWMDSSWHLDKDIRVKGNKIYSPETCAFVPQEVNTLLIKHKDKRGNLPIGVTKSKNRYAARVSCSKVQIYLGLFVTIEEAFQAYKTAKEAYIKEIANRWKDKIEEKLYNALINYQVEITD